MPGHPRFSLASAQEAAAEGRIAQWVGEFLASRGSDNAALAAGLAEREHEWWGPALVPIDRLERLAGPERDALVPIARDEWEDDVETMEHAIEEGWEPPPLIAERQGDRLLLQDGNHRYEALVREGAREAWAIVYSDEPHGGSPGGSGSSGWSSVGGTSRRPTAR
jgi:hypothetical protein